MEIKNILWPSDLSELGNSALPYVQDLAHKYGAKVHLLYVAQDMEQADHWYGDADPRMLDTLQKHECDFASHFLQDACKDKLQGCPAFERHILKGEPAPTIANFAEDNNIDVIVMASHGRGQSSGESAHLGSVTDRVLRIAPVPVLVARPE